MERTPPCRKGDRIELVSMVDPYGPIEPGARGTVAHDPVWVIDAWSVPVNWDNGRGLNPVVPPDRIRVVGRVEEGADDAG